MLKSIKVISFDLDDTLWDCASVMIRAEQALYEWLALNCPSITLRYKPEELRDVRLSMDIQYPQHSHDMKHMRLLMLKKLMNEANYPDVMAEEAFNIFYGHRNRVTIFDDVAPALEWLKNKFELVALTNGNADLNQIGINHYFSHYITSAEVGFSKPHIAMFSRLLNLKGCKPEEVLHVGDHPHADVDGARNAGMKSVWINRSEFLWPDYLPLPDYEVTCLKNLCLLFQGESND